MRSALEWARLVTVTALLPVGLAGLGMCGLVLLVDASALPLDALFVAAGSALIGLVLLPQDPPSARRARSSNAANAGWERARVTATMGSSMPSRVASARTP